MRLCDVLFHGKARQICRQVMADWEKQGYHLVVDDRHHRYVYKRLKELGLARRRMLVDIKNPKRRRYALVPNKAQLLEICAQVERIVEKKVGWFFKA